MREDSYQALPEQIMIRETYIGGKILITTLKDPSTTPRQALKDLYRSRWQVELDLRNIKTTLGMETLSCKSPQMAEKEMWIYFLAYNLIRIIMAQSAALVNILPRTLSFKHTLQLWVLWSRKLALSDEKQLMHLFELIAQQQVGDRPGRVEPRAVKRRPKPLPLLTKHRHEAQATIIKYGHPPKQREWNKKRNLEATVKNALA